MAERCHACGQTIKQPRESRELAIRYTDEDVAMCDFLYKQVAQNFPFAAGKAPGKLEFEAMNKLHRLDGRDYRTIGIVIAWSQKDPFWSKNIRSASKLRKQFDTLMIQAAGDIKQQNARVVSV